MRLFVIVVIIACILVHSREVEDIASSEDGVEFLLIAVIQFLLTVVGTDDEAIVSVVSFE